jgi:hypothetical protein
MLRFTGASMQHLTHTLVKGHLCAPSLKIVSFFSMDVAIQEKLSKWYNRAALVYFQATTYT